MSQILFKPAQRVWEPPPRIEARAGVAKLGAVDLAYWDTGGPGEAVVLLHPFTGSHQIWG